MLTIQAYGLCAFLILRICSWLRNKEITLLLQIISCFFFSYHYHLLGAFSGFTASITLVFILVFVYFHKKKLFSKKLTMGLVCMVVIINAIISYVDICSLLLIISLCIYCFDLINVDNFKNKICKIIFIVLWMIYGYIVGSYITFIEGIYITFFTGLSLAEIITSRNKTIKYE